MIPAPPPLPPGAIGHLSPNPGSDAVLEHRPDVAVHPVIRAIVAARLQQLLGGSAGHHAAPQLVSEHGASHPTAAPGLVSEHGAGQGGAGHRPFIGPVALPAGPAFVGGHSVPSGGGEFLPPPSFAPAPTGAVAHLPSVPTQDGIAALITHFLRGRAPSYRL